MAEAGANAEVRFHDKVLQSVGTRGVSSDCIYFSGYDMDRAV
jgi:hypothetical protein